MMPQYVIRLIPSGDTGRKLAQIRDAVGAHRVVPASLSGLYGYTFFFDERQRTYVNFYANEMKFACAPNTPAMREKLQLVRNAVLLLW